MREPVSAVIADLHARIGDGPGAGALLVAAARDMEEAVDNADHRARWGWWRRAAEGYCRNRTDETSAMITSCRRQQAIHE